MTSGTRPILRHCTAYRRRGLTWFAPCADDLPGDRIPSTGCDDPRWVASYASGKRGGVCAPMVLR
jgi:hypothetical protein